MAMKLHHLVWPPPPVHLAFARRASDRPPPTTEPAASAAALPDDLLEHPRPAPAKTMGRSSISAARDLQEAVTVGNLWVRPPLAWIRPPWPSPPPRSSPASPASCSPDRAELQRSTPASTALTRCHAKSPAQHQRALAQQLHPNGVGHHDEVVILSSGIPSYLQKG